MANGIYLFGELCGLAALFKRAEMRLFLGTDVMKVCLFTGRMLDDGLLTEVLMEARSGQFLLGLGFLFDLVSGVFKSV